MPTFAPGPFADREPFPPIQWPDYGIELRALLAPVVATLGASDRVLVPLTATIATNSGAGLDHAYATTIGQADAELATHAGDGSDLTAFDLNDRGQVTIVLRDQVAQFLPPVDAPIPIDFTAPPGPPQPTHPPDDTDTGTGNI